MYKIMAIFILLFVSTNAWAQTSKCDSLSESDKSRTEKLFNEIHSYGCCTDTIAECNKNTESCKTPIFISNEICSLMLKRKNDKEIKDAIQERAKVMASTDAPVTIEIKPEHIWGNPESKVVLTVYVCARCPYCSQHVPRLIRALEQTDLKDKIAINMRFFPIKVHENATPAALAFEAAAQQNMLWPYVIKSYDNFDAYTLNKMYVWAEEVGMDVDKFRASMKDNVVRKTVADSKKEGFKNGVVTTPTFFFNGQKMNMKFDPATIISLFEEALATMQ